MYGQTYDESIAKAQQYLEAHRDALWRIQDLYAWSSAMADSDLEAIGFPAAEVAGFKSAVADANQEAVLYNGGGLGSYPANYNFSASQRRFLGP